MNFHMGNKESQSMLCLLLVMLLVSFIPWPPTATPERFEIPADHLSNCTALNKSLRCAHRPLNAYKLRGSFCSYGVTALIHFTCIVSEEKRKCLIQVPAYMLPRTYGTRDLFWTESSAWSWLLWCRMERKPILLQRSRWSRQSTVRLRQGLTTLPALCYLLCNERVRPSA